MPRACDVVLRYLDSYVEAGAAPEESVLKHLEDCPGCSREFEARGRIGRALRQAVQNQGESQYLEAKVRLGLRESRARGESGWTWSRRLAAAVTVLAVCSGGWIAYQLGHLRLTTASQEAYIASISRRVGSVLRVGLGDHVHCTVFRKFPKVTPPASEMAGQLGSEYAALLPIVRQQVPSAYRIVMAHRCSYKGRKFVHLALKDRSGLISLVITSKGAKESFQNDSLRPMLSDSAVPIYTGSVQRFAIAGFETPEHLVFLVSDLGEAENTALLAGMAAPVRDLLAVANRLG